MSFTKMSQKPGLPTQGAGWSLPLSEYTLKHNPALYWTTVKLLCELGGIPPKESGFKDSRECLQYARAFLEEHTELPLGRGDRHDDISDGANDNLIARTNKMHLGAEVKEEDAVLGDDASEDAVVAEERKDTKVAKKGKQVKVLKAGKRAKAEEDEEEDGEDGGDGAAAAPPALGSGTQKTKGLPIGTVFTPTGDNFLPDYVKNAKGQLHELAKLPQRQSTIPWGMDRKRVAWFSKFQLIEKSRINAVAIAIYGTADKGRCHKCESGYNPFGDCYRLPGYFGGSCANCQWDHQVKKCKHHTGHLAYLKQEADKKGKKKDGKKGEEKGEEKNEKKGEEKNEKKNEKKGEEKNENLAKRKRDGEDEGRDTKKMKM